MEIRRDDYLEEIKAVMHNGLVKVITGIRRCGKSYFLFTIFRNYLKSIGIDDEQIVSVQRYISPVRQLITHRHSAAAGRSAG